MKQRLVSVAQDMPKPVNPLIRVAIVWVGMVLIWLLLGTIRDVLWGSGFTGYTFGGHVASAVLATLLAVPFVVAVRRWLDRGTLEGIGFQLSLAAVRPFATGALTFLLPFAAGLILVIAAGWANAVPMAPVIEIMLFVPVLAVLVFLFEALPEELAFRGYIYSNLATVMSRLWAVLVQAVLFAGWGAVLWLIGSGVVSLDRLSMFFFMGAVIGAIRVITGSVWASIGFHVAFQTAAQLLLNEARGHFTIVNTGMLQFIALGIVPFSLAIMVIGIFYKKPAGWLERAR